MSDISMLGHLAAAAAAMVAGTVNAIAGGGTLISFPVLTAIGVPTIHANATNTVALCPGYIGGTYAQRSDLRGLGRSLRAQIVAAGLGGLAGSILLITTSEAVFRTIVPFLILAACALLAVQDRMRAWLAGRAAARGGSGGRTNRAAEVVAVAGAAVYGGYFGAGLGIMIVAVLGLISDRPFVQLNAVKQLLAFVINVCAASFLASSGKVEWTLVLVMAPCALLGGNAGGRLARSLPARRLRACIIVFGVIVALVYLVR